METWTDEALRRIRAEIEREERDERIRRSHRRRVMSLRAHRFTAGWSQHELARRAGVSQGTISRVEALRQLPFPATCKLIADTLEVAVTDIREFCTSAREPAS